jgi:SAM-dependent methyltransferase
MAVQGAERAIGVDLSLENTRSARAQNARLESRIAVAAASLLALPFPDRLFDFVHCNGVLHHLADSEEGLRELVRVLRQGGTLYVSVYGRGGVITWLALAGRGAARLVPRAWARWLLQRGLRLEGLLVSNILDILYVPVQRRFTEAELRRHFRAAGLTDLRRLRNPTWLFAGRFERLLHASAWQPDSRLGRLLHGEGWIIMVGRRAAPATG